MCGTVTTDEQKTEMIRIMRSFESNHRTSDCNDLQWSGGNVTYNLILAYAKDIPIEKDMQNNPISPLTSITGYAKELIKFYGNYGIKLVITIIEKPCTTCAFHDDINWGHYDI